MPHNNRHKRIEQFERACRERGLPVTLQRRAVLGEILGRSDHPTADQIYETLKTRLHGLSRTTVYRILETLVQFGVITRTCHPGSAARFDPKVRQHHHLVCTQCEQVIDLEATHLNKVRWPNVQKVGFQIQGYHIHFHGICAGCRKRGSAKERMARNLGGRSNRAPADVRSNRSSKRRRTGS